MSCHSRSLCVCEHTENFDVCLFVYEDIHTHNTTTTVCIIDSTVRRSRALYMETIHILGRVYTMFVRQRKEGGSSDSSKVLSSEISMPSVLYAQLDTFAIDE